MDKRAAKREAHVWAARAIEGQSLAAHDLADSYDSAEDGARVAAALEELIREHYRRGRETR